MLWVTDSKYIMYRESFNKMRTKNHLLLYTVPCVHVFKVIEEVADWVHVAEMLAVLVHNLKHLIEGHSNLNFTQRHAKTHKVRKNTNHQTRLNMQILYFQFFSYSSSWAPHPKNICSQISIPPTCIVSSPAGSVAWTAPPDDTHREAGTHSGQ